MKREPAFASEAELCAVFMAWAKKAGWTPYPETAGWDVLLVGPDDIQIGVQAKLRFNMHVLAQSLPDRWDLQCEAAGPDFRAVLVPDIPAGLGTIAGSLGITVFRPTRFDHCREGPIIEFLPELGVNRFIRTWDENWHWCSPMKRHQLPAYIPDVAAGSPSPVRLTDWKIKALKVCARLELNGKVSRADFKQIGLDPRAWTGPRGWLDASDERGVYVRSDRLRFDSQHPDVYKRVLADVRAEMAKGLELTSP